MAVQTRAESEQRLLKILQQEEKRGFDDRAVMGGLDRFLRNFADRFPSDSPVMDIILTLPAHGYGSLTPEQRKDWARSLSAPRPARPASRPRLSRSNELTERSHESDAGLRSSIDRLSIKAPTAEKIRKIKRSVGPIASVHDLITHWPFRHIDYGQLTPVARLQPGDRTTLARVASLEAPWGGNRGRPVRAVLTDDFGRIDAIWFNQSWVARQLKQGQEYVFSGRVGYFNGRAQFENPEYEAANEETQQMIARGRLVPVYPSTTGLPQRTLRRAVSLALKGYLQLVPELLPQAIREDADLLEQHPAISQYHYPATSVEYESAERRLGFDEFFVKQLVVLARRRQWQSGPPAPQLTLNPAQRSGFLQSLPFALTGAQDRAMRTVLEDLERPVPMSRLLQGDVGSGKTVVAVAALIAAVAYGCQAVLMAPTEILAEQHFRTVTAILGGDDAEGSIREAQLPYLDGRTIRIGHLSGGQKGSTKKVVREALASGEIDIAIGTHALIEESVDFARLGFAVVDEQHRFGVVQRDRLKLKGTSPHLLVMTATPIPRTLALTVYGDLDTTVIDEMPPGRQTIDTEYISPAARDEAYRFLRDQVQAGRQAFIICPLVEESEAIEARAAVQEYERLSSEVYPDLRLALLHGRMKPAEKDRVMTEFRDRGADILVSTSVIEVGIDIPNATVIMIEGADRFGLSQLHQFRGRVGRGQDKSYCLLLADDPSEEAEERLRIVERIHDGFELAEEDLRIRGEGEYYGVRQSGLADFRIARLTDEDLLAKARELARRVLDENPSLAGDDYGDLRRQVTEFASSRNILLAFH